MRYWLFKSEPDAFGIDDLARDGRTEWSGVRNFRARNIMREMQVGDLGFFYHSSVKPPGVAGICEVVEVAHPDPTQFDAKSEYYDPTSRAERPKWWCVTVAYVRKFNRLVPLEELRHVAPLEGMPLLWRGQRLSVQPVTESQWHVIVDLENAPPATNPDGSLGLFQT
jgi:predicted RNA-binding protein with PUA-like domain